MKKLKLPKCLVIVKVRPCTAACVPGS